MIRTTLQSALCFFLTPLLIAQQGGLTFPPKTAIANTAEAPEITLRSGTAIDLRIAQAINSASAKVGDTVKFSLSEDLELDGKLIAPAGTLSIASVSRVRQKTAMHDGDIRVSDIRMDVSGQQVRFHGGSLKPEDWDDSWAFIIPAIVIFPIGIASLVRMANARRHSAPQTIEAFDLKYSTGARFHSSVLHSVRVRPDMLPAAIRSNVKVD